MSAKQIRRSVSTLAGNTGQQRICPKENNSSILYVFACIIQKIMSNFFFPSPQVPRYVTCVTCDKFQSSCWQHCVWQHCLRLLYVLQYCVRTVGVRLCSVHLCGNEYVIVYSRVPAIHLHNAKKLYKPPRQFLFYLRGTDIQVAKTVFHATDYKVLWTLVWLQSWEPG